MQYSISFSIREHGISPAVLDQRIKCVHVQLNSRHVHRVLALTILEQRMRSSKLQQRFYYEWVSAQYRLVQWKFVAAVDTGFSFFHKEVEDVEVEVAAG